MPVVFGQGKGRDEHRVAELKQGMIDQIPVDHGPGLLVVHRQKALVELGLLHQGRFIAQQDMQKRELRDVAAEDDHTDGERSRENQARRPPQDCPEYGGQNQGQGRDPRVGAIKPGFHPVAGDQFQGGEQQEYQQGTDQLSNTASERIRGSAAATSDPTYGTMRRIAATAPHSTA